MEDAHQPGSEDVPLMPYSCHQCRSRKLKCDRLKPACTRCVGSKGKCQYPTSRKRQAVTVTKPRVQDMEARLMDLEYRLKQSQEARSDGTGSANSPFEAQLIGTGRFEQLPPQDMVEDLTSIYFENLHPQAPMLHRSRYVASLYLPAHMQPPMCLQYAVLALGAVLSPVYNHLAQALYRRGRSYLEADEMKEDGQHFITLGHCQAWVLLGFFEVQNLWFSRAAMSTSRSVRLAQFLGLDRLDGESGLGPTMPPPRDWTEQEERRRTMWAVFCDDRHTSSTSGWPSLIDVTRIGTMLPASEEAYQNCMEEPSTTLTEALNHSSSPLSAYACRIVSAHLFYECLDHTYRDIADPNPGNAQESSFWRRHQDLNNGIATAFINLPDNLRCPENISNRDAASVNLQLHTATICLHRIGAARAKKHGPQPSILAGTQVRLLPAAQEIFSILAGLRDVNTMFRNPIMAFASFMAAYVFLEDFLHTHNLESEQRMASLLDLMIAIGQENPVTASLSVQMAHEWKKHGIDSSVMGKVQHLMVAMAKNGPLMGQQNDSSGSVLFCPFEAPSNVPDGAPRAYPGTFLT